MSSLLVFNRVYRLEILQVMLVFSIPLASLSAIFFMNASVSDFFIKDFPDTCKLFWEKLLMFKVLCHEINNFLKVLKIKLVLSVYMAIVFKFFSCLVIVMEKTKVKVLACFYENTC
jgi:hypothetical protein